MSKNKITLDSGKSWPRTCLVFAFTEDRKELLVIEKLRGMGRGKLTFPGGKIQDHESVKEGALRELFEETGLRVDGEIVERGFVEFIFEKGNEDSVNWSNFCHLFEVTVSTEIRLKMAAQSLDNTECRPFWATFDTLDWDRFWPDDRNWVPFIVKGQTVERRVIFKCDGNVRSANFLKSPLG
jgi:8-oxo-dGTP diphosphatase